jgi:hypothetical protein
VSDDAIILVCGRVRNLEQKLTVPDSVIDVCHDCEEMVWVSPEGIEFAYTTHPETHIICTECALSGEGEPDEINAVPGSPFSQRYAEALFEAMRRVWKEGN